MGTSDFGLHKILIYAMKSREGKGRKYLEKENIWSAEENMNGGGKKANIWRRKYLAI